MDGFRQYRDLTLIDLGGRTFVVACDSSGGIGGKARDRLSCPPELVGRMAARTALLEAFCVGAMPLCVIDNLCCEMEPTGRGILAGIRKELADAGADVPVTGSTEENFFVDVTCVGVTVLAAAGEGGLRMGPVLAGDSLVLVGRPLVGEEVLADMAAGARGMVSYADARRLLAAPGVRELAPVGSRGILSEAAGLARLHGLDFEADEAAVLRRGIDLTASAGPSTCLICAVSPEGEERARVEGRGVLIGRFL